MYSKRGKDPVEVTIILEKINPSLKLCASKKVTLNVNGDERTAFRFTVNKDGEITEINHLPKTLAASRVQNNNAYDREWENENYGEEPEGE
jgi:hypothetical protein